MEPTTESPTPPPTRPYGRLLWVVAGATYGVGDTATTLVGVGSGSATEAGPVAATLFETFSPSAILGLKLLLFGVTYLTYRLLRPRSRTSATGFRTPADAVPLALAIVGTLVTAWNLVVLLDGQP
jgi:hypothetical protein